MEHSNERAGERRQVKFTHQNFPTATKRGKFAYQTRDGVFYPTVCTGCWWQAFAVKRDIMALGPFPPRMPLSLDLLLYSSDCHINNLTLNINFQLQLSVFSPINILFFIYESKFSH